jgi:hypothetical protein
VSEYSHILLQKMRTFRRHSGVSAASGDMVSSRRVPLEHPADPGGRSRIAAFGEHAPRILLAIVPHKTTAFLQRADLYSRFKRQARERILIPKSIFSIQRQTTIVEIQLFKFSLQATGRQQRMVTVAIPRN